MITSMLALAGVALACLMACKSTDDLKRDCARGERGACEAACDKSVFGAGGCFDAAQSHRREAGVDHESVAWRQAREYFDRSCKGGHGDGCLFSAQMVEAPFGPVDPSSESKMLPPTISDELLAQRRGLLEKACQSDSKEGCKRLGDVLLGVDATASFAAYEKACRRGARADECVRARKKEVALGQRFADACGRGVADDCTRLGDLLHRVDPPRAARLFVTECKMRGLEGLPGGMLAFVRSRARQAATGRSLAEATKPSPALPDRPIAGAVSVGNVTVKGRVPRVTIDRLLRARQAAFEACYAALDGDAGVTASLTLRVLIDRTGDPWKISPKPNELPAGLVECVRGAVDTLRFPEPVHGLATVEIPIRFSTDEPSDD